MCAHFSASCLARTTVIMSEPCSGASVTLYFAERRELSRESADPACLHRVGRGLDRKKAHNGGEREDDTHMIFL